MSGADGRGVEARELAAERTRVLRALDGEAMTGPAVFRRIRERSAGTQAGTDIGQSVAKDDESLLYPALHGLEASWRLQAAWSSDASGKKRRIYRRRRLLPGRFGEAR